MVIDIDPRFASILKNSIQYTLTDLKHWNIIFKIENKKFIENEGHPILSTKVKSENSTQGRSRRIIRSQRRLLILCNWQESSQSAKTVFMIT